MCFICCYVLVFNLLTYKNQKKMKVKCKNNKVTTKGLTLGKIYDVISIEDCAGKLYRIIDDNGDNKRYSVDFFDIVSE